MPQYVDYTFVMSQDLYNELLNTENTSEIEESKTSPASTWLTFYAGSEKYAVLSTEIREILRNNEIYPVPFVPPYIKGVVNCYGAPYAVLDISAFLGHETQSSKLYMIIKDDNHLALQIDDLQEFHTDNEITVQTMANGKDYEYYNSALTFENETIPILNLDKIVSSIRTDIEKI